MVGTGEKWPFQLEPVDQKLWLFLVVREESDIRWKIQAFTCG